MSHLDIMDRMSQKGMRNLSIEKLPMEESHAKVCDFCRYYCYGYIHLK